MPRWSPSRRPTSSARVIDVVEVEGAEIRIVLGKVRDDPRREDALDGTRVDSDVIQAVGRLAGSSYVDHPGRFELDRPG